MSSEPAMSLDHHRLDQEAWNDGLVIRCTDLGKCYQIYDNPKSRLKQALWRGRRQYFREFWALRHVSFDVKRGESLGIIGRNGSGKSTLLQLLCGTLTPTEGTLRANGRIAALLELGSGFNPEFTGLENIYLNAAMLGLTEHEIESRLDEILSFADIGEFINQPVKTYSSGMSVRLAFAVIAHVDANILVIDEALAVGDAIFVQRCMRFIRRMRDERCLLFVSHDPEAVKSLCSHSLWLSQGAPKAHGICRSVILDYMHYCQAESHGDHHDFSSLRQSNAAANNNSTDSPELSDTTLTAGVDYHDYETITSWKNNFSNAVGWTTGDAELISIRLKPIGHDETNFILRGGEKVEIEICAKTNKRLSKPILGFLINDRLGQNLVGENTLVLRNVDELLPVQKDSLLTARFRLWFPMLPSGSYFLMASVADGDLTSNVQHNWVENAIELTVHSSRVRYGLAGAFITSVEFSIDGHPS